MFARYICYVLGILTFGLLQCSSTCGDGLRTRDVTCVDSFGKKVEDTKCPKKSKPVSQESCSSKPCTKIWIHPKWPHKVFTYNSSNDLTMSSNYLTIKTFFFGHTILQLHLCQLYILLISIHNMRWELLWILTDVDLIINDDAIPHKPREYFAIQKPINEEH